MSVTFPTRHILDIPDEILVEILWYLNARERAILGNSSERFHTLLFRDRTFLRDLDFSQEGRLTSTMDLQPYFENDTTSKCILKVNLKNVNCMEPERMLNDFIGKASNLVDINIHGVKLGDLLQVGSFLAPLKLVQRLSLDWPVVKSDDIERYNEIDDALNQPFGRLKYLSVRTYFDECLWNFLYYVRLCQQLKELHIFHGNGEDDFSFMQDIPDLENLEIVEFCGDFAHSLKEEFLNSMLLSPENCTGWGLFQPLDNKCFRFDKNIEVCEELADRSFITTLPDSWEWTLGKRLCFDQLLRAVIEITQENNKMEFCSPKLGEEERCALKIDDAKLLLKNPRHQIKYLYLGDSIGTKCMVHRYALAAANVTELYLSDVMKIKTSTPKQTDCETQNDLVNKSPTESTFKMLVEITPQVEELTLNGRPGELEVDEAWDLDALCFIQGWKNLKSLRLLSLPISDAEFLIGIGKHCEALEKLEFYNVGPVNSCCYTMKLALMLAHCKNLTDFSMYANNIGSVSQVLDSLAQNIELKKVRLKSSGDMNNTENLISSVEQLLRSCKKLITFICIIDGIPQDVSDQLASALRRLRGELHRPSLQSQVVCKSNSNDGTEFETVYEDKSAPSFPYTWDDYSYT